MNKYKHPVLALVLALSITSVYAQSTGSSSGGQGGGTTATTTTFQSWMNSHSEKNNGRVSRQAYMDEASRRWDSMDMDKMGLTSAQINGMYSPAAVMGGSTPSTINEKKGVTR